MADELECDKREAWLITQEIVRMFGPMPQVCKPASRRKASRYDAPMWTLQLHKASGYFAEAANFLRKTGRIAAADHYMQVAAFFDWMWHHKTGTERRLRS